MQGLADRPMRSRQRRTGALTDPDRYNGGMRSVNMAGVVD